MTGKYKFGYAIHTDGADFIEAPLNLEDDTLLELRLFDGDGEYRTYRSSLNAAFGEREISGEQGYGLLPDGAVIDGRFIYDEALYLDKDEKRSNDRTVFATGGGFYHLPEEAEGADMMLVRYYCDYDEDGVARVTDWRFCGFLCSSEWKGAK